MLDQLEISYRFFRRSGIVHTLKQAAEERGQILEQVIHSILLRIRPNQYVLILVAGQARVFRSALRACLKQSHLTLASEVEILEVTGYALGSVSPFGIKRPVRILVDKSVFEQDEITIGSGERYPTIIMSKNDLAKALGEVETGVFLAGHTAWVLGLLLLARYSSAIFSGTG